MRERSSVQPGSSCQLPEPSGDEFLEVKPSANDDGILAEVVDENHSVDFSADGQLKGLNSFGEPDNALGMLGGVCIDDVPSSEKSRSYL